MIAPPRVASPGRTRARSRHKEQQRPRAQTDWMSFGAALEASGRSASPADRQPIPQHFTPATTQAPVQQQPPQQDDFLGIFSSPPQPSSVPNATTEPPPQNLPFSAPMVSQSPPSAPLSAPTAAGGNPFRQSSYGGGMEWDIPSAEDAPPAPPRPGEDDEPKKKKKKKKKEGRGRSKTVGSKATSPRAPPPHPAPPPPATEDDDLDAAAAGAPPRPKKKKKEIDVLPLLHTGVMLVKFKMTGGARGKSKRFHVTPDNKFLCWEGTKFAKSAEDRQVFLGDIQEVTKLDAGAVSGARLKNPQWAMSIIYNQKGQSKTLNLCAQTQFHYEMVYESLKRLSKDAKPEHIDAETGEKAGGRQLDSMFELYLEFTKEVLPEHLRRQKFKWEAVPPEEVQARADESRDRAMTTPIGHDGSGMSVNVQYPGSEQVPTANSEQIMQRDRAFSAGLAGAR